MAGAFGWALNELGFRRAVNRHVRTTVFSGKLRYMRSNRKRAMTSRGGDMPVCKRAAPAATVPLLLGLLALGGCHGSYYTASNLPEQFAALPPRKIESIDLTKFVHTAARTDSIYAGDVLDVTVATGTEDRTPPTWSLRAGDDGMVMVPLVGQVHVVGYKLTDAENEICRASIDRDVFRHPTVTIEIKNRRSNRVTVGGAVVEPRVINLPPESSDLGTALLAVGGLREDADTIVEIRYPASQRQQGATPWADGPAVAGRGQDGLVGYERQHAAASSIRSVRVDLLSEAASEGERYYLEDGAVVMVREQEPTTFQVIGLVNRPDQFEVAAGQDVRLLDAIAMAGGRTLQLADEVRVIRNVPEHAKPVVIELSVRDAKRDGNSNIRLMSGDVVSVEETPVTFLVETIRSFFRFGFSSGIPGF